MSQYCPWHHSGLCLCGGHPSQVSFSGSLMQSSSHKAESQLFVFNLKPKDKTSASFQGSWLITRVGSALTPTGLSDPTATDGAGQWRCPSLSLANYINCLSAVAWAPARKGIVTEVIPKKEDSLNALSHVILPCQGEQTKQHLGSFSPLLLSQPDSLRDLMEIAAGVAANLGCKLK